MSSFMRKDLVRQMDKGLKQTQKDETHWRPLGYISTNFFN